MICDYSAGGEGSCDYSAGGGGSVIIQQEEDPVIIQQEEDPVIIQQEEEDPVIILQEEKDPVIIQQEEEDLEHKRPGIRSAFSNFPDSARDEEAAANTEALMTNQHPSLCRGVCQPPMASAVVSARDEGVSAGVCFSGTGPDPRHSGGPLHWLRDHREERGEVRERLDSGPSANTDPQSWVYSLCHDSPCHHRGHCINLRQSYSCICPRPYTGHDCEEELVAARFGHEDSQSVAVFTVTDDITENLSLSLFLRTRRQRCLLLAVSSNNTLYFTLRLEDGKVLVQLGSFGLIQSNRTVNDGEVHFVSVDLSNGTMKLDVQGEEQDHVEAGSVDVRAGDAVYVGGLWKSEQTAAFGGGLKGCVQDLRINDRRLLFFSSVDSTKEDFPLVHRENVSEGCTGDDQCSRNPCLNGGMCFSVWDDFSCSCAPSTSGRRCEEVRWCELGPCPAGAECRVLGRGYDCYSNATFLNDSTVLTFRGNGQILRNLTSLSLDLRTRKRNAAVLHAEHASSFITLSLQEGHLVLELQSDGEEEEQEEQEEEEEEERKVSTVSISSRTVVSDGEWHHVHLFMATPWTQTSRWTLVLDQEVEAASTSRTRAGNLDFLRQGVDIFLGGLAPEAGWALAGCLSTVELGGIALSYFTSADVNLPRLQPDQFSLVSSGAPLLGCSGALVCEPSPCLNGGLCQDLFNWFNCSCVGGWAGRRCDLYINACASQPCRHGNCSGRGLQYQCECEVGFSGQDCDLEVDPCEKHLCANGATCLQGPKGYSCLCPDNYTGPLCSERVRELPWYMIVRSVRPKLPVSVCGDSLRNYTCFNGGNCTERDLSCDLVPVCYDPVVPVCYDPVVPVCYDPVVPVCYNPVVPVCYDPVVPVCYNPVVPVCYNPVVPVCYNPVVPVCYNPVVPVCYNPVVPVCYNPVVPVCYDPVVPVCYDPVVPVCYDPVVPVCYDPVVPVCYNPVVPVCYDPVVQVCYNPVVPVCYDPVVQVCYNPVVPVCYDPVVQVCYHPVVPVCYDPVVPVCYNPVVPVCYDPVVPVCYNPVVPVCYNPVVPVFYNLVVPVCYNPVVPVVPVCYNPVVPVCYNPVVPVCYNPVVPVYYNLVVPVCYNPVVPVCYNPVVPVCYNPVVPVFYNLVVPVCYNPVVPVVPVCYNPVVPVCYTLWSLCAMTLWSLCAMTLWSLCAMTLWSLCAMTLWCEQEVDECRSSPCLNGGYCRNLMNRFVCVCDMSFAGDVCEIDVSDIYFYVALLLWQNLFQLLSFLILRLDDEPEVDWGEGD
uniref:Uncharacterized protein n=1 Tax=Knipowitschia caucasica TaxID=637954 RepID=A0AAV2KU01_KNICA